MHTHSLDPYQPRHSVIHQADARIKLIGALAFILTASLMPVGAWPAYVLLWALGLSVIVLSELGLVSILRRALLAVLFALAAVPLIFTTPGPALISGPLGLTITLTGVERVLSIFFKSWISLQMALVLAQSTRFPELLLAMRALRVPALFVSIFGLMWRYLFVLADEANSLIQARAARSGLSAATAGNRTGGTLLWRSKVAGGMAGNLFLRASERGERIYAAMLARGYDGEPRSMAVPGIPGVQIAILAAGLVFLILVLVLSRLY
jgi:cobalt/nickel transport system permease protein